MFDDVWGLESKEVSPIGKELSLFDRLNEVERGRIPEAHRLESILQQQISQHMAPSHHDEHAEFDEFDTHVLERFNTLARNPVKEILLKLNLLDHSIKVNEFQRSFRHSDTERRSRSDEVLKLKNFKKDSTLKLFKSKNQERYEHVGPKVTSSQDGKVNKMEKRDYAWLMISRCSRSHSKQAKEQAQDLKSTITTSNHKLMIEVKDYEIKTKFEA
ncbi:hypothetical protein Tco_0756971 [Tanacetum coccineum]